MANVQWKRLVRNIAAKRRAGKPCSLFLPYFSGTCTTYDIREHNGRAFMVMEFPDGVTLKHRIAGRPLEPDLVLDLGISLADAATTSRSRRFCTPAERVRSLA